MRAVNGIFIDRLKDTRKSKGLTQHDMGRVIRRTRSTYSLIENGKQSPTIDMMNAISYALDKPVQYFFDLNC